MKRTLPLIASVLLLASCRGTRPPNYGNAQLGFGGVLVSARIITPNGETNVGLMEMNLESDNERYRMRFRPKETSLLRIEPDIYRLHPTRTPFGAVEARMRVRIDGRSYRVPFPRSVLRLRPIEVPPTKVVPIGILEARLLPIERGKRPIIKVRLDDSIPARRWLLESVIDKQMDSKTAPNIRDATITWTRALEQALIRLQGEEERKRRFKPGR
jgi:hypothetical protein